jgi:hypothetical protein
MNEFLIAMSRDMSINRHQGESDDSFIYRLCYSALGQWCIRTAQNSSQNSSDGITGTTKHNQTIVINELLQRYAIMFPGIGKRFIDTGNQLMNYPVHVRRVYEETGYLLTGKSNRNQLANFGRCIPVGSTYLYFGVPNRKYVVNGLGVFSNPTSYVSTTQQFMVRDNLTCEEYFQSRYASTDFYEKDMDIGGLQFFNPLSNNIPSLSWSKQMATDCSIARKSEFGPFYRVIKEFEKSLLYADENLEPQRDSLISYEYRRLFFALKAHYKNPLSAVIVKQDEEYSKIKISGQLPNREYYYLLLLSWPFNHAFDKVNFLLKSDFVSDATAILRNIGIKVIGG